MQQTTVQSPVVVLVAIQVLMLVLVFVFGLLAVRAAKRPMPWRWWFHPMEAMSAGGVGAAVWVVSGVRAAPAAIAIAAGAGALLGLMAGAMARPFAAAGRLVLSRTGASWLLLMLTYVALAAAAWFTPKPFMSAAAVLVAWATGLVVGDAGARTLKGARWAGVVRATPMSPPHPLEAPTAATTGDGVAASGTPAASGGAAASGVATSKAALDDRPGWARALAEDMATAGMDPHERERRARAQARDRSEGSSGRRGLFGRGKK